MLLIAKLLPAIADATSSIERLALIRALLWEAFEAAIQASDAVTTEGVRINARDRCATFMLSGTHFVVTWPRPLQDSALTALRFCIEAVVENN